MTEDTVLTGNLSTLVMVASNTSRACSKSIEGSTSLSTCCFLRAIDVNLLMRQTAPTTPIFWYLMSGFINCFFNKMSRSLVGDESYSNSQQAKEILRRLQMGHRSTGRKRCCRSCEFG